VTISRAAVGRFSTLGMLLLALPARAHHSASMFDMQNEVTLTGTVREFQFTNPHCWIQLSVPENGIAGEWSIQMGAPIQVFQGGWNSHTLKPGDQIKVTLHPTRDGTKGGNFISATGADGQHLGKAL
jgi:Family of unknown function (DUF6152)